MNTFLGIFIIGLGILIGAIIINIGASAIGLSSWWDVIKTMKFSDVSIISWVYLILIYPFLLGAIGYYLYKVIF